MNDFYYNLLPEAGQKTLALEYKKRVFAIFALAVSFLMFMMSILLLPTLYIVREKHNLLETELETARRGALGSGKEIVTKTEIANEAARALAPGNTENPSELMKLVAGKRPSGISITSITVTLREGVQSVSVVGIATDRETLLSFRREFDRTPPFSGAEIPVGSFTKAKNLPFSMDIKVASPSDSAGNSLTP